MQETISIWRRLKTVSKFASSETVEYNRKEDIAEIFLLRIWGMDSFDLWRVQFRVVIVDGQVDCLGGVVH